MRRDLRSAKDLEGYQDLTKSLQDRFRNITGGFPREFSCSRAVFRVSSVWLVTDASLVSAWPELEQKEPAPGAGNGAASGAKVRVALRCGHL